MKKVLYGLLLLSAGYAFGGIVEDAVNQVVEMALKDGVENLVFARLYYSLHTNRASDYGLTSEKAKKWDAYFQEWYKSAANNSSELRDFWRKLEAKDSFEVRTAYGFKFDYFRTQVYTELFKAMAKKGKVVLQYGPLKGTVVANSEINV